MSLTKKDLRDALAPLKKRLDETATKKDLEKIEGLLETVARQVNWLVENASTTTELRMLISALNAKGTSIDERAILAAGDQLRRDAASS